MHRCTLLAGSTKLTPASAPAREGCSNEVQMSKKIVGSFRKQIIGIGCRRTAGQVQLVRCTDLMLFLGLLRVVYLYWYCTSRSTSTRYSTRYSVLVQVLYIVQSTLLLTLSYGV